MAREFLGVLGVLAVYAEQALPIVHRLTQVLVSAFPERIDPVLYMKRSTPKGENQMRNLLSVLVLAAATASLLAQQSRVEVTKPTTPQDDSKPNSDKVPDAYAVSGQFERVVVLRFKYQTDLLAGIEKMVTDQKIRNAVFLSGIGSVRNYHIHAVSNRTFPSKDIFVKDPTAPADIVSVNGYVIDGRVHAHITLTNENKAFGGHIEPGNNVFTFATITLGVFGDAVDLSRVDDKTYR